MGWGTSFNTEIYLNRQIFINKFDLEDKMRKIDDQINEYETKFKMYAISTPKDIVSEENLEYTVGYINDIINDQIEEYCELIINRYQLCLFLEYLDNGGNIKGELEN